MRICWCVLSWLYHPIMCVASRFLSALNEPFWALQIWNQPGTKQTCLQSDNIDEPAASAHALKSDASGDDLFLYFTQRQDLSYALFSSQHAFADLREERGDQIYTQSFLWLIRRFNSEWYNFGYLINIVHNYKYGYSQLSAWQLFLVK